MLINEIVAHIREIGKWASKNGFSNRGRHPMSYYADELEKSFDVVLKAYKTLTDCENAYMYFYIVKTMEMHPELAEKYKSLWTPVYMGWDRDGKPLKELYGICVKHNPELEALPELLTYLIKYGKL